MVEVVIDSVRVSLTNQQRIVVLRESNVERYLPIWIGPYEAEAITIALQDIEVARPQTHDLLKNLLQSINARLLRVEVIALREDVFFGNLVVELKDGQVLNIDCRPSDALALSVRTHVPILVAREVIENAGVVPEQETELEEGDAEVPPSGEIEEEAEERLSVFEDFLQNLDIDAESDEDEDKDEEDDEDKPSPAA
jgi:bifunctional DNase/RNase